LLLESDSGGLTRRKPKRERGAASRSLTWTELVRLRSNRKFAEGLPRMEV
jgi:hypothetical protein